LILESAGQSGILGLLSAMSALFIVILGAIWLVYTFHEATRRKGFLKKKVEDWDVDITGILKILSLSGLIIGILAIIAGVGSLILDEAPSLAYQAIAGVNERNMFTSVFLIVLGLLTFLKPLNDVPVAGVIGLLASSFICILISFMIPDNIVQFIGGYINPKILMAVLFIIIFAIVAITVKFWTSGLMWISKMISWPPLAFIIAIFCFIQGGLLLTMGISIIP